MDGLPELIGKSQLNARATGQREHLVGEIALGVGPLVGIAHVEAPDAIQQVGERRGVQRRVALTLAQQAMVCVECELGALVVDTCLGDVEVQCGQLLLHELDEAPGRSRLNLVGEHGVGRPTLEAEHLLVSRVIEPDPDPAG